jgi:hypothetical protein
MPPAISNPDEPPFGALTRQRNTGRHDRWFFIGLAFAATLLIFVGFAPTYFLKSWYQTPALPAVLHVHALLMTSWVVLFITQVSLVAARRTDLHRRLGVAGAVLAAMTTVMTVVAVIDGLRAPYGLAAFVPTHILVSLGSMALFVGFVCASLLLRRNPEAHKRLMFIAIAILLTPPVGRLIGGPSVLQALAVYAVADSMVVAMIVYDVVTRRRVHTALAWGGLTLVIIQFLQEAAQHTDIGRAFVEWLRA